MNALVSLILCIFVTLSASIGVAGGITTGNGGGFAICPDGRWYAPDYLISSKNSMGSPRRVIDYRQDLQIILFEMRRLQDPLAPRFARFVDRLFQSRNQTFKEQPYDWRPSSNVVTVNGTSDIRMRLFPHCQIFIPTFNLFHFKGDNENIDIEYDPKVIAAILRQDNGNEQLSYLLFHEWLWIATPDSAPRQKAYYNRLFHSQRISQMTAQRYHALREQFFNYYNDRNDFVNMRPF